MKIAVIQLQSVLDPALNLKTIRSFLEEAKSRGTEAVFLPEVFYSMSDGTKPTPYLVEGHNEHYEAIRSLSTDFKMYVLGGSAATRVDGKIMNRAYNFDPSGKDLTHYDKMNLFSCDLLLRFGVWLVTYKNRDKFDVAAVAVIQPDGERFGNDV